MKLLLAITGLVLMSLGTRAQSVVHEYASVEFSPGLRKLGVFSTAAPEKVIDLKTIHMSKRNLDIISFFNEVQELEAQGWKVTGNDVVALDRGVHMYVWTLQKPRP